MVGKERPRAFPLYIHGPSSRRLLLCVPKRTTVGLGFVLLHDKRIRTTPAQNQVHKRGVDCCLVAWGFCHLTHATGVQSAPNFYGMLIDTREIDWRFSPPENSPISALCVFSSLRMSHTQKDGLHTPHSNFSERTGERVNRAGKGGIKTKITWLE